MPGILKTFRGIQPDRGSPLDQTKRRATPSISRHSIMSGLSGLDTGNLRAYVKGDPKVTQRKDMATMLLVMLIPITSLIALTSIQFSVSVAKYQVVEKAKTAIKEEFEIAAVTLNLQVERGMTAMYLSSGGTNVEAYDRLMKKQAETDRSILEITAWPERGMNATDTQTIRSSNDLRTFIQNYRNNVPKDDIPFEYNIRFYTNITHALMRQIEKKHEMPSKYAIWENMVATAAILRATDAVGIQRALGSTFFTLCRFSAANFVWFVSLDGETEAFLKTAFFYCGECKELYSSTAKVEQELFTTIEKKKNLMGDSLWQDNCSDFYDASTNFSNSQAWFNDITDYISILVKVRLFTKDFMMTSLAEIEGSAGVSLITYSLVLTVITFGSLALSFWYSRNVQAIIRSVRNYTHKLHDKSHALASEKKRTEIILHQMLPKAVADQLKIGEEVKAVHYDCVTIMFSDIVKFTKFASSITPMQVVDVLNALYGILDDEVDKYDAYKVETIGDAYMIVSGAPKQNGNRHVREIAEVALAFTSAVTSFKVPHAPNHQMTIRIGLHSGSCVAGVVGVKMPRYCLFGDTVLMAGNMEQTAKEMTIHISETTMTLLSKHPGYQVEERGLVSIKGENKKTYWLLGGAKETPRTGDQNLRFNLADRDGTQQL